MEGNGYTVKELITEFVLPELREIKGKVDSKVDRTEFEKLERRMSVSEEAQLKEDDVVRILTEKSDKSTNLGLNRAQLRAAWIMTACTCLIMLLAAHSSGVL